MSVQRLVVRLGGADEAFVMLKVDVCEHSSATLHGNGPQTVSLECRDCRKTYTVDNMSGIATVTAT